MINSRITLGLVVIALVSISAACGLTKKAEPAQPIVGILELPVSLRSSASEPSDSHKVEIGLMEMRVDDEKSIPLANGKIPESERNGDMVPKLDAALSSPSKSRITLLVHASATYDTLVSVLASAQKAGIRTAVFKVRKPGGVADTGWLELSNFKVMPLTTEEVTFDNIAPRPWSDFVNVWDQVFAACQSASTGSCREKKVKIAQGGNVQIILFSAGTGITFTFERRGAPPPEVTQKEIDTKREKELKRKLEPKEINPILEGIPTEFVAEYEKMPFEGDAMFQFRASEAVVKPSPVSATMAPLCGKNACGALVQGRDDTSVLWTVAMIGAAFPEGTPAPQLTFMKLTKR